MARSERRYRVVIYQTYNGKEEHVAHVEGIEGRVPEVCIRTASRGEDGPIFQVLGDILADTWLQIGHEVARISTPGGIQDGGKSGL